MAFANLNDFVFVKRFSERDAQMSQEGLKVFWWNIGCGLETYEIKKKDKLQTTELERNLINLSKSEYKPDVLILGEYCPQYMSDKDKNQLLGHYRHSFHLQRNIPKNSSFSRGGTSGNGLLILSNYPMSVLKNEVLYGNESNKEDKDNRKYLLFKLTKDNREYYINPVHLVNPWRKLYDNLGTLGVFNELTSGESNSNAIQIKNLIQKYENYIHRVEKFLTIGDFNSPGSIYGFSGFGYRLMANYFDSLFRGYVNTFLGEGPFPASDIDHAFGVNVRVNYATVWPLQGSKHLPLYVVID